MRRWLIGGSYDGAHHTEFVLEGGHLQPFENEVVIPAGVLFKVLGDYRLLAEQAASLLADAGAPGAAAIFEQAAAEGPPSASPY